LFKAYGRRLAGRVRAADGEALPAFEIATLTEIANVAAPPLLDGLRDRLTTGGFPCLDLGALGPPHGALRVDVPLRPRMDYTFDIFADGDESNLLWRLRFSTSRFATLAELARELHS